MRVLGDECVDPRVNRPLPAIAQREFDVLLTIDTGLEFQKNLTGFQIGLVVVHLPKNQLIHYRAIQKELPAENTAPGLVIHVRTP